MILNRVKVIKNNYFKSNFLANLGLSETGLEFLIDT